jgi:hypothetical protein
VAAAAGFREPVGAARAVFSAIFKRKAITGSQPLYRLKRDAFGVSPPCFSRVYPYEKRRAGLCVSSRSAVATNLQQRKRGRLAPAGRNGVGTWAGRPASIIARLHIGALPPQLLHPGADSSKIVSSARAGHTAQLFHPRPDRWEIVGSWGSAHVFSGK